MLHNISKVLLSEEQIQTRVKELAAELSKEYAGKDPVFIGVLKGVVVFFADMMKELDFPFYYGKNLDALYESYAADESTAKNALITFEEQYPDVLQEDNLDDILSHLMEQQDNLMN